MLVEITLEGLWPEDVDYLEKDFAYAFAQHKREFIHTIRSLEDKGYKPNMVVKLLQKASSSMDLNIESLKNAAWSIYRRELFDFEVEVVGGDTELSGANERGVDVVVRVWLSEFYLSAVERFRRNLGFGAKRWFRELGRGRKQWMDIFEKGTEKDYGYIDSYTVKNVSDRYDGREDFFTGG